MTTTAPPPEHDPEFAAMVEASRKRAAIRANLGLPPRPLDEYLLREPHVHEPDHCCPYFPHQHHVVPHRMCILR